MTEEHQGCDCPDARAFRAVTAALRDGPASAAVERLYAEWLARALSDASTQVADARDWTRVLRPYAERTGYTDDDVPEWARESNAALARIRALTSGNRESVTDVTTPPV